MLITLTTDFGLDDPFVAMMKGVILGRCPGVTIVDICHTSAAQDIGAASRTLQQTAPFFPPGTIHVAVIDPGVGSRRRIICLEANSQFFLAPDNGLLTPFFAAAEQIFALDNDSLYLQPLSTTFHGRDIFAPVAAALAAGLASSELGPSLAPHQLVRLEPPRPSRVNDELRGQCLQADHFGNMTCNISKADLEEFLEGNATPLITVAETTITGLSSCYGPATSRAIALINSNNMLEIAISHGNASRDLGLRPGTPVVIRKDMVC